MNPPTTISALDNTLQPILNKLAAIGAFDRIYGRLRVELVKGVDNLKTIDKDRPRKLPLSVEEGKNLPVLPDEKLGGLLFFINTREVKVIDTEPGWVTTSKSQAKEYSLALLAWWDTRVSDLSRDEVQFLIEKVLGSSFDWQTESIEDQLATRVFDGIDYDFNNHAYLMHPFAGLRIEGTLTVTESICLY